mgnify:FL=1
MKFEFRHRVEVEGEYVGAIFETDSNLWFYRPLEGEKLRKSRKWSKNKDSALYYSLEDLMETL